MLNFSSDREINTTRHVSDMLTAHVMTFLFIAIFDWRACLRFFRPTTWFKVYLEFFCDKIDAQNSEEKHDHLKRDARKIFVESMERGMAIPFIFIDDKVRTVSHKRNVVGNIPTDHRQQKKTNSHRRKTQPIWNEELYTTRKTTKKNIERKIVKKTTDTRKICRKFISRQYNKVDPVFQSQYEIHRESVEKGWIEWVVSMRRAFSKHSIASSSFPFSTYNSPSGGPRFMARSVAQQRRAKMPLRLGEAQLSASNPAHGHMGRRVPGTDRQGVLKISSGLFGRRRPTATIATSL